ncbi:NucA/NucB deoxyribonuclease domain-containing protein [Paenibacillus sp. RC67]|uniref:NucA/NucB deoxyribonuclease domain-containing protein n=1 Tax=Paenibacillus sp. RC67 TaxID=3039392 RepID=UPI0024AD5102|nr:NucA/NucB deoxyribonuclease domain-containing protein [Paenibacillus sp. RC67]
MGSVFYEKHYDHVETSSTANVQLIFPTDRFPETAQHIKDAIASGESSICTIDRKGAEDNRKKSLHAIPTKKGYDRDEWPMAMCSEGGEGADIRYISPSDNRGAGSWVSNQVEKYPDGTKVMFIVK